MVSKGEMWVFDSSCITQPQSQIMTDSKAHNYIAQSHWEHHWNTVAYISVNDGASQAPTTKVSSLWWLVGRIVHRNIGNCISVMLSMWLRDAVMSFPKKQGNIHSISEKTFVLCTCRHSEYPRVQYKSRCKFLCSRGGEWQNCENQPTKRREKNKLTFKIAWWPLLFII